MIHDIPAKSRLLPTIPITSPQFVYRGARQTDVRATFERARLELGLPAERRCAPEVLSASPRDDLVGPGIRRAN
jgi:hypothetical protein